MIAMLEQLSAVAHDDLVADPVRDAEPDVNPQLLERNGPPIVGG